MNKQGGILTSINSILGLTFGSTYFCFGKSRQNHVSPQNSRAAVPGGDGGLERSFRRFGGGPARTVAGTFPFNSWCLGAKAVKAKAGCAG